MFYVVAHRSTHTGAKRGSANAFASRCFSQGRRRNALAPICHASYAAVVSARSAMKMMLARGANALNLPRQNHSVPCISGEQCVGKQNIAALFPGQPFGPARITTGGNASVRDDLLCVPFHLPEFGSILIYTEYIHSMDSLPCRSM